MPEGPEIRREADEIEQSISGKPLKKVYFKFEYLKEYELILEGSTLLFVQTVEKALFCILIVGLVFMGTINCMESGK